MKPSGETVSKDVDAQFETVPLSTFDLPDVMRFVLSSYGAAREADPALPPEMMGGAGAVGSLLRRLIPNGAVGLVGDGRLPGFMCVSASFEFKGLRAALIAEMCHAAPVPDGATAYRLLYQAVGEHLVRLDARLHIIAHFAHDTQLQQTLHELGFGSLLAERIRTLSTIDAPADIKITREDDLTVITDLEAEHMRYYRRPPIYLWKDDSRPSVRKRLLLHQERGHALFIHRKEGRPDAFLIVGRCTGADEGLTLTNTHTGQVIEACASPAVRGKGIGRALLSRSVEWAKEQGYSRLFFEHDTANIPGSAFWARHFNLYVWFAMRYVEDASGPTS